MANESTLVVLSLIAGIGLGALLSRRNPSSTSSVSGNTFMCSHIETVQEDETEHGFPILGVETCNKEATAILGGTSYCEDHFEDYIEEMTTISTKDS